MTEIKQEFKEERISHWFAIAIELYWSTELYFTHFIATCFAGTGVVRSAEGDQWCNQ